jgi:TolB-like protein/DNA-binding winged helix-turn-helix (wHTH) protein/tetratricopeptide (TPR) repeat protein
MEVPARFRRVRFGVFEIDLHAGELLKNGLKIKLQEQPFQILTMLLSRPGEVVTREELRQKLWPTDTFVDFDVGLNTIIKRLRDTLGDSAESPRYVETLPRRGYRFIAPVEEASASSGPVLIAEERGAGTTEPPRKPWRLGTFWIGALALAGLLALLVGLYAGAFKDRYWKKPGAAHIESIAVLPLKSLSNDSEQDYFADGITEAVITDLGKVSALRVISRTSVMRYKDTKRPLPEIARELQVEALVEGTVARSGGRVRITANLVQASPERHLWAESYERDLRDVIALQNDVASAIVHEIQVKVTSQEHTRLTTTRVVNPEAYQVYLKGRYFWNKWNEEGLNKSIEYFSRAIEIDPEYAPAWAGLSDAYDLLGDLGFSPPREALPRAKQAALKALGLDDTLAEAHVSLGGVLLHLEWSWDAAEKELQRATVLDPNSAMAHQWYGYYLMAMGRFEEAVREMQRARQLDPLSANKCGSLGEALYRAGGYDEAIQQFREMAEFDPNSGGPHFDLAEAYERKRMYKEAVSELAGVLRLASRPDIAALIERAYLSSDYSEAKRVFLRYDLVDLVQKTKRGYVSAYDIAADYAMLGEKNKSLEWLAKAFEVHDAALIYIRVDDEFESVRTDPRYTELIRRIGLRR